MELALDVGDPKVLRTLIGRVCLGRDAFHAVSLEPDFGRRGAAGTPRGGQINGGQLTAAPPRADGQGECPFGRDGSQDLVQSGQLVTVGRLAALEQILLLNQAVVPETPMLLAFFQLPRFLFHPT